MTPDRLSRPTVAPAAPHPIRAAAVVIYGTFALLIVAIPQSLVNWLQDKEIGTIQGTLLQGAEAMQAASYRAGIDIAYRRTRAVFLELTGKQDN
jgi:hypothetical protein